MNEVEKYLFDLQGFIVLRDVLDDAELVELNRLIDEQDLGPPPGSSENFNFGSSNEAVNPGGFLEWGKPLCELLDHPRIMPILRFVLGDGFRIDHYYGIYMREGTSALRLHGGGTPYDPPEYYHYQNGSMFNGLTVVAWNLVNSGGQQGGFVGVPGSHKSNFPCPTEIREAHVGAECVTCPDAPAGSVVIFTEALTHGTAPWAADHDRRSLLFKYSPPQQSWGPDYAVPPNSVELSERQQMLFERPYFARRRSLFSEDAVQNYKQTISNST